MFTTQLHGNSYTFSDSSIPVIVIANRHLSLVMLISHDREYEIKFESGKAATNILQQQLSPLRHVRADNQCDDVRVHTDQSALTSIHRHVRCCRASNIPQIHPESRQSRTARLPKRSHLYGWCRLRNADHMTYHCLHYSVSQIVWQSFSTSDAFLTGNFDFFLTKLFRKCLYWFNLHYWRK